jgi:adhesin HecA-like repeat protein
MTLKRLWRTSASAAVLALAASVATPQASAMSLEEAMAIAVESNPEIGQAIENREAVEFELRQARGLYLPSIDLEASAGTRRLDNQSRRALGLQNDTLNSAQVGLTVTQTIFDSGARRAEVNAQAARVDSASFRVLERSELIGLAVVQDYLEYKRAAVVIGPSDTAGANELSAIKGQKRPPFFTLASSGGQGPGTYALPLSEADSAAAALVAAIGEGKRHVALLIGEGAAAAEVEKQLSAAVLDNGGLIEARARYRNTPESLAAAVKAVADAETRPEVIVIANGSEAAAPLAAALSAAKLKPGLLIGTSAWTQADIASSSVEGALIASVDRSEMNPMTERFRQAYGREPQLHEAFAYDAMALSAGLARAGGEAAFAAQNLTNPQGFRSTTGVFRLMPDGSVQRLLALHRVTKGKLKRVGEAQAAF